MMLMQKPPTIKSNSEMVVVWALLAEIRNTPVHIKLNHVINPHS